MNCSLISLFPFLIIELSQPLWVPGAVNEREAETLRGQKGRVKVVAGDGSGGSSREQR